MVGRGAQWPKGFPLPWNYREYYLIILSLLLFHGIIAWIRASLRSCYFHGNIAEFFAGIDCQDQSNDDISSSSSHELYSDLHYSVWMVLIVMSILGNGWIGFWLNRDDNHHYRRFLQFLRLEFDTRLGMHSPR